MPTLPWCVGPMGVGVGVGTLLSSQIPQAPSDANPNELNIQDSSALSSGCLVCRFIADFFASVCEARGVCDPLIEKVLGVFSGTSLGEVNRTLIASIINHCKNTWVCVHIYDLWRFVILDFVP